MFQQWLRQRSQPWAYFYQGIVCLWSNGFDDGINNGYINQKMLAKPLACYVLTGQMPRTAARLGRKRLAAAFA